MEPEEFWSPMGRLTLVASTVNLGVLATVYQAQFHALGSTTG